MSRVTSLLFLLATGCLITQDDHAAWLDQDGDNVRRDEDCDDHDTGVRGGADWFPDADGDGWGDESADALVACERPSGHTDQLGDCDDGSAAVHPGAEETWYDGVDANCDGASDYDQDADGYDSDAYSGTDCDDSDADINPGVTETWYDGVDGDCSGDGDYDQDADGYDSDGYGGDDCDDTTSAVYPGATETWYDGVDTDCDGASDYDQDADGYDSDAYSGTDCDDTDAAVSPGESETWYDGVDTDCSGGSDYDQDGDGYDSDDYAGTDCEDTVASANPGVSGDDATTNNMVDDDCDGWIDEDDVGSGALIFSEVSRMSTAGSASSYSTNRSANWFEILNTQTFDIALDDVAFRVCDKFGTSYDDGFTDDEPAWGECDTTDWFAISPDAGLSIAAGGYATFCADDTVWDDPTLCDYTWADTTTWTGSNPSGRAYSVDATLYKDENGMLGVYYAGSFVDDVGWYYGSDGTTDWPLRVRYTMNLSLSVTTSADNDDPDYWCDADSGNTWATSPIDNYGTPGTGDSSCP